jgi:two-component system NtrC family sensor kinase
MSGLNKIGFKLILAVAATTAVIIGVFAFINNERHTNSLIKEVERHANQLSETVKHSTKFDMLHNRREHISQIIQTIGEQPQIRKVRILNKVGEIIYSSDETDVGKMVDKNAESCYKCHAADQPLQKLPINERTRIFRTRTDSTRFLGIITPIYNETSCWNAECHAHSESQSILGVLDVTLSLEEADKQIRQSQIEIFIFALSAIVVLGIIIGLFVKRWVDYPVNSLLKATQQISAGNLEYTVNDLGKDEIGMLAKSFNNMVLKLSQARLQLFQSDKLASLGKLAAGVAHEINNPLTGVLTYSTYLLKRTQNQPEIQEDLKVIVRETIRSREIVKSLLDFARQSIPKKGIADLHEIIEKSIAVVENQLSLNKVVLKKNFDPGLAKIVVDSNQLQQVFINLLVNAVDAIGSKGGEISITTSMINLPPLGTIQIKRASCPKRHNLVDNDEKINGLPAIKLKLLHNSSETMIYLDPIYGRNKHKNLHSIDDASGIKVLCPQCSVSLFDDTSRCPKCGSIIFSFDVAGQGKVQFCLIENCNWQKWEAVDRAGPTNYAEVIVKDSGSGISKEELSKIFEPFYTTKGQKGTGLGLSVIWGIIDNHNGSIAVESEPGKGTQFKIRLPYEGNR